MNVDELIQLLLDNGFTSGWAMHDDQLTVWEHDEDPPAPLIRPDVDEVSAVFGV